MILCAFRLKSASDEERDSQRTAKTEKNCTFFFLWIKFELSSVTEQPFRFGKKKASTTLEDTLAEHSPARTPPGGKRDPPCVHTPHPPSQQRSGELGNGLNFRGFDSVKRKQQKNTKKKYKKQRNRHSWIRLDTHKHRGHSRGKPTDVTGYPHPLLLNAPQY